MTMVSLMLAGGTMIAQHTFNELTYSKDADYEKNPKAYTITKKIIKHGQKLKIQQARGGGFAISLKAL